MRTPEQGPRGGYPSSPESEPQPKGFQVRVENPDLIFKAVEGGVSGDLGLLLMESPVSEVKVELQSEKDRFNLHGEISLGFHARYDRHIGVVDILEASAKKLVENNPGGKLIERGGKFIAAASRGTKFVLGNDFMGKVIISTGSVEVMGAQEPLQLIPAPPSTRESYDTVISDFIEVLGAAVEEAYRADGKVSPEQELVLRPPKIGFKGRSGGKGRGVFAEIETPAQLLGKIEIEKPDFGFENIGGQPEAKKEIQGLALALKEPELYRKWGTKPPKGIVLYGPPGTGKTLMAKALASQADARFFHVEASDIASKWYGESEALVKNIFELASQGEEKTIIFFDEIDAIAPAREGAHEATHRVVSTLLENMDGLSSKENVMVVASTNRLELIEPALIRAGRFDRWVEVPLPDGEGRKQILDIHMGKAGAVAGRDLFSDVGLDEIVSKTEGVSGADIAEVVRRVLEEKVRQEGTGLQPSLVKTEDILREIKNYERVRERKRAMGFISPPVRVEK